MKWLVVFICVLWAGSALSVTSRYAGKGMWHVEKAGVVEEAGSMEMEIARDMDKGLLTVTADFKDGRQEVLSLKEETYVNEDDRVLSHYVNSEGEKVDNPTCARIFRFETCRYEFKDGGRHVTMEDTCHHCSSFEIKEKRRFVSVTIKSDESTVHWKGMLNFSFSAKDLDYSASDFFDDILKHLWRK